MTGWRKFPTVGDVSGGNVQKGVVFIKSKTFHSSARGVKFLLVIMSNSSNTVQNGKGSKRRPGNLHSFHEGWERIFGKKDESKDSDKLELPLGKNIENVFVREQP